MSSEPTGATPKPDAETAAAVSAVDPRDPRERASWKSPAAWCTLIGVLVTGLIVDLWSKYWAFREIAGYPVDLEKSRILSDPPFEVPHHARVVALPGDLLDFRLVLNHGAVLGVGQGRREFFVVFTVIAMLLAALYFAQGTRARMRAAHVAFGLILAGGCGNLYDRVVYGAVRDFLHMLPGWSLPFGWKWPGTATGDVFPWVFNVADVMLLAGMAVFIVVSFLEDRRISKAEKAAQAKPA